MLLGVTKPLVAGDASSSLFGDQNRSYPDSGDRRVRFPSQNSKDLPLYSVSVCLNVYILLHLSTLPYLMHGNEDCGGTETKQKKTNTPTQHHDS